MLKNAAWLLALFLVLFVGTFLLLGGDIERPWSRADQADAEEFHQQVGPADQREPDRVRGPGLGDAPVTDLDAAVEDAPEDPTAPGRVRGRALSRAGHPIPTVQMRLVPGAGTLVRAQGDDWLIEDVPPGSYQLEVWAKEFVAARSEVVVRPGRSTWHEVRLQRGVRPRGKIVDETDQRGVADALIEFSGTARTRSQIDGTFTAPYVIPRTALDQITVSHPSYDRYTYIRQPTHDPEDMVLALSRGSATIKGQIIPDHETFQAKAARLRLYFSTGGRHDLRRQEIVPVAAGFTFERVHQGVYDLAIDFPGTQLPELHREVRVKMNETVEVRVNIGKGSAITGHILARAGDLGGRKIELMNGKGLTVAACATAADGSFKLTSVPEGSYRIKVWYGNPWFNTEAFEVDGRRERKVVVDCDMRRLRY